MQKQQRWSKLDTLEGISAKYLDNWVSDKEMIGIQR